jgi:cytoskeletal protein RodZ
MRTSALTCSMLVFLGLIACQQSPARTDALSADMARASVSSTELSLAPSVAERATTVSPQEQITNVPRVTRTRRIPRQAERPSPQVTLVASTAPAPATTVSQLSVQAPAPSGPSADVPAPEAEPAQLFPDPANAGHVGSLGPDPDRLIGPSKGKRGGRCGGGRSPIADMPMCSAIPITKF